MTKSKQGRLKVEPEELTIPFCYNLIAKIPLVEATGRLVGVSAETISERLGAMGCMANCETCPIKPLVEGIVGNPSIGLSSPEVAAFKPINTLYKAVQAMGRIGDK